MQPTGTTSFSALLGRVFWMMIGPLALAFLAYSIVRTGNGWFTAVDVAFLVVVGGLILARWLEFRGGNPQTATGEPAVAADFRRYCATVIIFGAVAWVAANWVGNYLLVR